MKIRISRYTLLVFLFSLLICGNLNAATRVALVSNYGESESIGKILDLALVQLSKDKDLIMLERQVIDKILAEHELSLSGLVDANTAARAGKLLDVELFVVLEQLPSKDKIWGLVVFNAGTGVRLADVSLATVSSEKIAESVAVGVKSAHKKHLLGAKGLKPVCLLTVRNADMPREMDSFCQAVGRLLERRLTGTAEIAVLERKRLEHVNKERTLASEAAIKNLMGSLVLIDLEFSRGKDDKGIIAEAVFRKADGGKISAVQTEVGVTNAYTISEELLHGIVEKLGTSIPDVRPNLKNESRRFAAESEFYSKHQDYRRAVEAAESAYALDPNEIWRGVQLQGALMAYAMHIKTVTEEELTKSLALAVRSARLDIENVQRWIKSGEIGTTADWDLLEYLRKIGGVRSGHSESTGRQIVEFRRLFRMMNLAVLQPAMERAANDPRNLNEYTRFLVALLRRYAHYFRHDQENWAAELCSILENWLRLGKKYELAGFDYSRNRFSCLMGNLYDLIQLDGVTEEDRRHFVRFFKIMVKDSDPVIQIFGKLGITTSETYCQNLPNKEIKKRFADFIRDFMKTRDKLPDNATLSIKRSYYTAAGIVLGEGGYAGGYEFRHKWDTHGLLIDFAEFMLNRREFLGMVMCDAIESLISRGQERDALRLTERTIECIKSKQYCDLQDYANFSDTLEEYRYKILGLKEPGPPAKTIAQPYSEKKLLYKTAGNGGGVLLIKKPLISGDHVYFVGLGGAADTEKQFLRALRVPLKAAGRGVQRLGDAEVKLEAWRDHEGGVITWAADEYVTGTALIGDQFFVGTKQDGVFVFSVTDSSVTRLNKRSGLPSDYVQGLIACRDKLYLALGEVLNSFMGTAKEGYIVSYRPDTGKINIIGSSRRKQKRSPIDNRTPLVCRYMTANAELNLVLIVMNVHEYKPPGLWQLEGDNEKLSFVQFLSSHNVHDHIYNSAANGCVVGTVAYDPQSGRKLRIGDGGLTLSCTPYSPVGRMFYRNGWLWSSNPYCRISMIGNKEEFLSTAEETPHFQPNEFFSTIDDGNKLLACDRYELWLLEIPDYPGAPTPAAGRIDPLEGSKIIQTETGQLESVRPAPYGKQVTHILDPPLKPYTFFAVGPKDTHLFYVNGEGIQEFDPISGALGVYIPGKARRSRSIKLAPDARHLLTGGFDGSLTVWDIRDRRRVSVFKPHKKSIRDLAISRDSRLVLTASRDRSAKILDLQSGKTLQTFRDRNAEFTSAAFSQDAVLAAAGTSREHVYVWETESGRRLHLFEESEMDIWHAHSSGEIEALAFSPDSTLLYDISADGVIHVWSLDDGKKRRELGKKLHKVESGVISRNVEMAALATDDEKVMIVNLRNGKLVQCLTSPSRHQGYGVQVLFTSNETQVIRVDSGSGICGWDVQSRELLYRHDTGGLINSLTMSRDGRRIIAGSRNGLLRLWDAQALRQLRNLDGGKNTIHSVAMSSSGAFCLSGSESGVVQLWDSGSDSANGELQGHTGKVLALDISANNRFALSGGADKDVVLWDLEKKKLVKRLTGHTDWITCVKFSPDGNRALTCGHDKTVRLWDLKSGRELKRLEGHVEVVGAVAFSANGKHAMSGSWDGLLVLWDLETGKKVHRFIGHNNVVQKVQFAPDGKHALSAGWDGTVRIWDTKTGKQLQVLNNHASLATDFAFIKDKVRIAFCFDEKLGLIDVPLTESLF